MSECWTIAPIPSADWATDGFDAACVADICRIDNAVLARAILGYATLGVPCDDLYGPPPPPSYDTTAVSQRAISGAAISGSSTGLVVITR